MIKHEYCYVNYPRKCVAPDKCWQDCKCGLCGKEISDCEYVTNWGSCNECFDKHIAKEYNK